MGYIEKQFNLEGKTAVLTGGGGVLAFAIGSGLAKAGINVVFCDIALERANEAARAVKDDGGEAIGLTMNVLDKKSLEEARDVILAKYKTIDILLNAAGGNMAGATISPDKTIFDIELGELDKVTDLNYKGTLLPILVFGKTMADQKKGSIINISSMAAFQSITRVVGYSAAKAAVSNLTIWMAMELAMKFSDKIRVNAIAPGFFITHQNREMLINNDGSYTDRSIKVLNNTPMGRFGEAEELVGAVLYLAGDSSSFVTGVVLPIDGGFSTFSGV